jgi:hypothetical protein
MTATRTVCCLCLAAIPVCHAAAQDVGEALDGRLTIVFQKVPLAEALKSLEAAAKTKIVLGDDAQGYARMPVSLDAADLPLQDVLEKLIEPHPLAIRVRQGRISIIHAKLLPARRVLGAMSAAKFVKTPLLDALERLSNLHRFDFAIAKHVDEAQPITYEARDLPLKTVLIRMLKTAGLSYRVVDEKILVVAEKLGRVELDDALSKTIQAEFRQTPLRQAIRTLADKARTDIVLGPELDDKREHLVTSSIKDLALKDALNRILMPLELTYRIRADAIQVIQIHPDHPNLVLDRVVSISFVNTPLEAGMNWLSDSQHVKIVLAKEVNRQEPISWVAEDDSLKTALKAMLAQQGLTYRVEEQAIHIVPLKPEQEAE